VIVILFLELQSMEYPVYHSMFSLSALSNRARSLSIHSGSTKVSAASPLKVPAEHNDVGP
jgi:hypothetical protein